MWKGTETKRQFLSGVWHAGLDREEMKMSKSVKYCENCGAEIEPGVKFCESCGRPVTAEAPPSRPSSARRPQPVVPPPSAPPATPPPINSTNPPAGMPPSSNIVYCSSCGTANSTGSRFCNNCGAGLVPGQAAVNPATPPPPPAVVPSPAAGTAGTAPKVTGKTSGAWWLLPLFFGLVGGLVGWALVKETDSSKAKRLLYFGISITVFWFIISIVILFLDYILFY